MNCRSQGSLSLTGPEGMLNALEIVFSVTIHFTDQEARPGQVLSSHHMVGEWPNGYMRTDGDFFSLGFQRRREVSVDSPISISLVGGQPSHQDSQEGPQQPWHSMEVVDTTHVLYFESEFKDRLEDKLGNQPWALHLPLPRTWWGR